MIMGQKWGFKRWGLALGLFAAATSACDGAADFAKPGQAGAAGESTAGDAGSGGHSRGGGGGLGSGGSLPMGGGGLAGEGGNGGSFAGEGGSLGEAGSGGADDGCEADKASGGVGADPSSLAFDATELQLNDVSLLFPLPQTEQELADGLLTMSAQGARGKLLRESLYSNVDDIFGSQVRPGVGGRPVAPYANLRVVALRLDPCFGTLEPPDSGAGCQNQLRWVVQRELLKCGCPWGRCPTPPTPSPSARVCACPVPSFLPLLFAFRLRRDHGGAACSAGAPHGAPRGGQALPGHVVRDRQLPTELQKGCAGTTATYSLREDGLVRVDPSDEAALKTISRRESDARVDRDVLGYVVRARCSRLSR